MNILKKLLARIRPRTAYDAWLEQGGSRVMDRLEKLEKHVHAIQVEDVMARVIEQGPPTDIPVNTVLITFDQ